MRYIRATIALQAQPVLMLGSPTAVPVNAAVPAHPFLGLSSDGCVPLSRRYVMQLPATRLWLTAQCA